MILASTFHAQVIIDYHAQLKQTLTSALPPLDNPEGFNHAQFVRLLFRLCHIVQSGGASKAAPNILTVD